VPLTSGQPLESGALVFDVAQMMDFSDHGRRPCGNPFHPHVGLGLSEAPDHVFVGESVLLRGRQILEVDGLE
jgi:hypothetical protein